MEHNHEFEGGHEHRHDHDHGPEHSKYEEALASITSVCTMRM